MGVNVVIPFQLLKFSLLGLSIAAPGVISLFNKILIKQKLPHINIINSNQEVIEDDELFSDNDKDMNCHLQHHIYQINISPETTFSDQDHYNLCLVISELPHQVKFQDMVSIMFRLSQGDVVSDIQ